MKKLKISLEWTIEERNFLHKMILTRQAQLAQKASETRKNVLHDPAFAEKLEAKKRSYYALLVLLKNDNSAEFLERKRKDYKDFILT